MAGLQRTLWSHEVNEIRKIDKLSFHFDSYLLAYSLFAVMLFDFWLVVHYGK